MEKLREIIVTILEEMGFVIFEKEEMDFNIGDYITDSIQFIGFILNIEQVLGMELTDDFLRFEVLISVNGLSNKLMDFCELNNVEVQKLEVTAECINNYID